MTTAFTTSLELEQFRPPKEQPHALLSKEQKKSTFTVPFLGPSGGTKNETAKSQNQQQRPTRATNKK